MANNTGSNQKSELRKHYFLEQYVVIAPKRGTRPHVLASDKTASVKTKKAPPIEKDPSVFEVTDDQGRWLVKVVDNLYPALSLNNPNAFGKQEVVLETSKRNTPFCNLEVEQIERVFTAYKHRLDALDSIKGINYVTIFKNQGLEAGASLNHTHSQIIATGIVPPQVLTEARAFTREQKRLGHSPLESVLRWEIEKQSRVIHHTTHVVTIAPYASRFPYEAWVVPKRQIRSVRDLTHQELTETITHLKNATTALSTVNMSYNFYLVEAISGWRHHWLIKITPRPKPDIWIQGGFEVSSNVIINHVAPEQAAQWYRKTIKKVC